MKLFISWSGSTSKAVALAFRRWLPSVLQFVQPYVSAEDVDKGSRWATEVAKELEGAGYGVLCVTRDNLTSTWLNFEAGALSKAFDTARVVPILFDLRPSDLTGPLAMFQAATTSREDILKLIQSINSAAPGSLDDSRLTEAVETWWPKLEEGLQEIRTATPSTAVSARRDTSEIVEEVLEGVRSLQRDMADFQGFATNRDRRLPETRQGELTRATTHEEFFRRISDFGVTGLVTRVTGQARVNIGRRLTKKERMYLERAAQELGFDDLEIVEDVLSEA